MQGTRTRRGCREGFRRCLLLVAGVGERAVHQTTDQQVVPRVRYPWERPMQAVRRLLAFTMPERRVCIRSEVGQVAHVEEGNTEGL